MPGNVRANMHYAIMASVRFTLSDKERLEVALKRTYSDLIFYCSSRTRKNEGRCESFEILVNKDRSGAAHVDAAEFEICYGVLLYMRVGCVVTAMSLKFSYAGDLLIARKCGHSLTTEKGFRRKQTTLNWSTAWRILDVSQLSRGWRNAAHLRFNGKVVTTCSILRGGRPCSVRLSSWMRSSCQEMAYSLDT